MLIIDPNAVNRANSGATVLVIGKLVITIHFFRNFLSIAWQLIIVLALFLVDMFCNYFILRIGTRWAYILFLAPKYFGQVLISLL